MSDAQALYEYRKQKSRARLSYMLLDIFLGGFIVAIVLMITLGRPVGVSESIGAGGAAFIFVEFFWQDSDRVYSPEIWYEGEKIKKAGFAAGHGAKGNAVWSGHDRTTGQLEGDSTYPFTMLTMDGFHLNSEDVLKVMNAPEDSSVTGKNYGYLWLSEPCAGQWAFRLRNVEEFIDLDAGAPVDLRIRLSYSVGEKNSDSRIVRESEVMAFRDANDSDLFSSLLIGNEDEVAIVELISEALARPNCPAI